MAKIMIADDDFAIGMEIEEMLTALGYDVVGQAGSGQEAVKMAQDLKPDIILMDIVMPGEMNGIGAAEKIRAESDIPVVFISGYADPEYIEKAKQIEPFGYVMKPFDEKEVRAFIEIALHKRKMELKLKKAHNRLEKANRGLQREIKERKETEKALRESEERYRTILDSIEEAYFEVDITGNFTFFNDSLSEILGYSNDELMGMNNRDYMTPESFKKIYNLFNQMYITGNITRKGGYEIIRKDGSRGFHEMSASLIKDQAGQPIGFRGIAHDITGRKQAEQAVKTSEQRLTQIINFLPDATFVIDTEGKVIAWNQAIEDMTGIKSQDMLGKGDYEYTIPFYGERRPALIDIVGKWDKDIEKKYQYIKEEEASLVTESYDPLVKPGGFLWGKASLLYDRNGEVIGAIESIRDITDMKIAEKVLRESEERFRTVADFTYDWEFWIAPDGHHIYVSPSCERITGFSPEEFMTDPGLLEKIVHPDDHSTVVNHLREEQNPEKRSPIDFRIITRSGEERWISHNCQAVYGVDGVFLGRRGSNRDITKRKQMEEELLKSKKLESLGVLAGGIGHDFNNLMTSVVGNISLAKMEMKPGSEVFRNLVEAEKASIQTKELTARLITFSKGGEPIKKTVAIDNLIKDSVDFSLKDSEIDARFSIPDDISPVEADEEQMKQVIHNIIANAQEAMAGQGTINVSCENADIGVKDTLILKHGKYVKISLKDQGPGIPEEDLIKIFDPYFSTKEMDTQKGMGLGLAVSDSIIKQHDGLIAVESELGAGATFSIYLPALSAESQAPGAKPPESHSQSSIVNSQYSIKKILVMDDEELVRDVSNGLLTRIGYKVEVAVDGVEAIELYRKAMESEKPFDMVILDLTNKVGMGGVKTIKRLLKIDPEVRAIVATGYSTDPIMSKFREHGFRGALPKPFTLDQLKMALDDAIAGE